MTLSGDCISIFTDEDGDFVIEDGAFWEIVNNAAARICMSDCTNESFVTIIDKTGNRWTYRGWQPGLLYQFVNSATGECANITLDPDRWDH